MSKRKSVLLISLLILALISCSAVNSIPNPFATATPTPTQTFTPSPTPSPAPTFTPTATFTPTPPPSGREKRPQPNGTTLLVDYDGGYQVTVTNEWTIVLLEKDEINKLIESLSSDSPIKQVILDTLKSADPKVFRAFIFNFQYASPTSGYVPNVNITFQDSPLLKHMSMEELVRTVKQTLPQYLKGITVTSSEVTTTKSGLEIGVLESTWKDTTKTKSTIYQKIVYFKTENGTVNMVLSTLAQDKIVLEPEFDQMLETIELLK